MRISIPAAILASIVIIGVALATTFTQCDYGPAGSATNTLTITSAGAQTETITIGVSATILVYNSDGSLANPQPAMDINPTQGTANHTYTIRLRAEGASFPTGGKVIVSRIDSTASTIPTGVFNSTP